MPDPENLDTAKTAFTPVDLPRPTETQHDPEVNELVYPPGAFEAQVLFAQKWSQLTGDDFNAVLASKTAVLHALSLGDPAELASLDPDLFASRDDPAEFSRRLYTIYESRPGSRYQAHNPFGAFGYDYVPSTGVVKVHFENPARGSSPLADDRLPERRQDMTGLLSDVRQHHPDARRVVSATWVRSTQHYQQIFPPDLDPAQDLMSPDMKLTGQSVWGQFIDKSGNLNTRVYDQFVGGVAAAGNVDELMNAFPYRVLKVDDPIEKYYDFYHVP